MEIYTKYFVLFLGFLKNGHKLIFSWLSHSIIYYIDL